MKRIPASLLGLLASLTLFIASVGSEITCIALFNQPKMPKQLQK